MPRKLAGVITKPLWMIFEQSWDSGKVLIFKKGEEEEEPGNYRSVKLTSSAW